MAPDGKEFLVHVLFKNEYKYEDEICCCRYKAMADDRKVPDICNGSRIQGKSNLKYWRCFYAFFLQGISYGV